MCGMHLQGHMQMESRQGAKDVLLSAIRATRRNGATVHSVREVCAAGTPPAPHICGSEGAKHTVWPDLICLQGTAATLPRPKRRGHEDLREVRVLQPRPKRLLIVTWPRPRTRIGPQKDRHSHGHRDLSKLVEDILGQIRGESEDGHPELQVICRGRGLQVQKRGLLREAIWHELGRQTVHRGK